MSHYIHIGRIAAPFGLNGACIVEHFFSTSMDFSVGSVLYIEKEKNQMIPFFVSDSSAKNQKETIVSFEDINSREASNVLVKKRIWLTESDFERIVPPDSPLFMLNFEVLDNGKSIGMVQSVLLQTQQILLTVLRDGHEIMIPLNESTLLKIDPKKKKIYVRLPDGLLEIYA